MYSFWYNEPTLLQTGATVQMERSSISTVAPVGCARLHLYWPRKHLPGNCGNELISVRQVPELSSRPPGCLRLESDLLIKQVPKT